MMDDKKLNEIIRPVPRPAHEVDCSLARVPAIISSLSDDYGGLDMEPDYQRGHVWTQEQQTHFIENLFRGVIPSSGLVIQFNCPDWYGDYSNSDLPRGLQCIDGLQRLTAIGVFLDGKVLPFGISIGELYGSSFDPRRMNFRIKLAIYNFKTRAEVLSHYLAVNSGTPHTEQEIARVKKMLDEARI